MIDREYTKRIKNLNLPKGTIGAPLLLDGEVVMNLIRPAFKASNELLAAVDDWVIAN
jgi:hypothetical protein